MTISHNHANASAQAQSDVRISSKRLQCPKSQTKPAPRYSHPRHSRPISSACSGGSQTGPSASSNRIPHISLQRLLYSLLCSLRSRQCNYEGKLTKNPVLISNFYVPFAAFFVPHEISHPSVFGIYMVLPEFATQILISYCSEIPENLYVREGRLEGLSYRISLLQWLLPELVVSDLLAGHLGHEYTENITFGHSLIQFSGMRCSHHIRQEAWGVS
jgi:uncharacterized Zn-finger protein